jgi:hypothetical protein
MRPFMTQLLTKAHTSFFHPGRQSESNHAGSPISPSLRKVSHVVPLDNGRAIRLTLCAPRFGRSVCVWGGETMRTMTLSVVVGSCFFRPHLEMRTGVFLGISPPSRHSRAAGADRDVHRPVRLYSENITTRSLTSRPFPPPPLPAGRRPPPPAPSPSRVAASSR